jgi:signal transduction histidine kinase
LRPLADYPYNRRLATDERPVILDIGPDETTWRANLDFLEPIRCNIGIPMKVRDRIIGALMLDSRQANFYSERDLRIATAFGRHAAVAVENARLYMAAQRELQDRIRAEEELVRAKEAADEGSKAKSAFLATMSHELRTPLNAIIGFSAVLDTKIADKLNEKQLRFLRNINVSGEYLLHIINDILDLSKIEAGKMTFDPEEVDAEESIEAICRVVKGMALPRNIELRTEIEAGIGTLWTDPIRFKQILYNLLSNAVKFSPDHSTVLTKACNQTARESLIHRDSIEITVIDQGPGIAPEDRQVIFEEFRQLNRGARRPQGTGLGLALVNRLVQLMNGTIRLRSQIGKGSEFSVVLPRKSRQ